MINPINISTNPIHYTNKQAKETKPANVSTPNFELSDYKTGQAILARNNISFRNLSTPIEVTDKYNKKIEGKDHLDLPNVHIYEYSDTNLKVFLDENANMQENPTVEIRLYIKDNKKNNYSQIKKELFKSTIFQNLTEQHISAKIEDTNQGLFTITLKNNENKKGIFTKINNIITNPNISIDSLEIHKQKLINKVEKQNNSDFIFLDKKNLKSKELCQQEISNITVADLKNFSKEMINNAEVTYFITLNKNHLDKQSKKQLLKEINNGINAKFQKNVGNDMPIPSVLNNGSALYIHDENIKGIEFNYPCRENNLREYLIDLFTNFLLIFLAEPYYNEDSDINMMKVPLQANDSNKSYTYHNLKFNMPKPEFTNLTPQRALKIHKEIVGMVYDTDFTITLNDIKQVFKEKFNEEINKNYKENLNNQNLYQYEYDIFQLYEILDSIQTSDIKRHIEKYILNQEPIVRYNNRTEDNKI